VLAKNIYSGLISPLGWQLEEGFMRRYTAA
jgi:hypothetical protein